MSISTTLVWNLFTSEVNWTYIAQFQRILLYTVLFKFFLKFSKSSKKLTQIWDRTILVIWCTYKKKLMYNINYRKIQLEMWRTHSQLYLSSPEILQFVSSLRDNLCETFSNFYHNIHIWNQDIMTKIIIFRLCLLFLEF